MNTCPPSLSHTHTRIYKSTIPSGNNFGSVLFPSVFFLVHAFRFDILTLHQTVLMSVLLTRLPSGVPSTLASCSKAECFHQKKKECSDSLEHLRQSLRPSWMWNQEGNTGNKNEGPIQSLFLKASEIRCFQDTKNVTQLRGIVFKSVTCKSGCFSFVLWSNPYFQWKVSNIFFCAPVIWNHSLSSGDPSLSHGETDSAGNIW